MKDNFNFISLPPDKIKEIIKDILDITTNNVAVCTLYKGTITLFTDRLKYTSNEPIYILVPNDYKKNEDGPGWLYDISRFKIYRMDKDYIKSIGVDPEDLTDDRTKFTLDDELLIYTSKEGLPKQATEFTLREQACLTLKVPNSGTFWIDELIRESLKT